ncbi:MAG: hypothetical protein QNJ70_14190 [Xenococcaceae cyanobacterium MO_207.B15]|nr:hypothetical protein [Xenococcaceae cyanobacterium MO_207.B15]
MTLSVKNPKRAIVTICSSNYFPYARILFHSLQKYHPEASLFLCLADTPNSEIDLGIEGVEVIPAEKLGISNFPDFAFRYDIMEFNTAVKPFVMKLLIEERNFEQVVYLDPDIELFAPLTPIFEAMKAGANFVLTPHITEPAEFKEFPDDIGIMKAGIYNLGFIALNNSPDAIAFLHWWSRKLRFQCINQQDRGIFVDQKFVDLLPAFHDNVAILRDRTLNVAYWNLDQRKLEQTQQGWIIDGEPLIFFHFSGIEPNHPQRLSKYTERFNGNLAPAIQALVNDYISKLLQYGYGKKPIPEYGYQRFDNGIAIADIMRRCYRDLPQPWENNPFETFYNYLNQPSGLVSAISPWGITLLMYYVWQQRTDLQQSFDLNNSEDRLHYTLWFIHHAPEYSIDDYFVSPIYTKLTRAENKYKLNILFAQISGKIVCKLKKNLKTWLPSHIKQPLKLRFIRK